MNRYRLVTVALAGVLLSSCDWEDRIDVADVNARNALALIQRQEARIDELERKIRNLESDFFLRLR